MEQKFYCSSRMDHPVRIAYITPEAPPFSGGGIATFINNITKGMFEAGIFCEVFAPAFDGENEITCLNGVTFHRIASKSPAGFRMDIVPYFLNRHKEKNFTIVESCEIHASLYELLREKIPGVRYVIRVQMPEVLQTWLNDYYESRWLKLRYVLGAFRRLKCDLGFWNKTDVKRKKNKEYQVCEMADAIIAPSHSFKDWLISYWKLPATKIEVIPHLFDFRTMGDGLQKAAGEKAAGTRILFVGKLNVHKGVVNLAKAAKNLLAKYPSVEFILVGEDWPMKYRFGRQNTSVILGKIVNNDSRFKMTGKISYDELASFYEAADICIFPSLWEAWGYTCTEAMSFGKAVIGSKYGGMADAINDHHNGLLIDPYQVNSLEEALSALIENGPLRDKLGENAQITTRTTLGFEPLVNANLSFYKNTVA